jgi:hypothetical protein
LSGAGFDRKNVSGLTHTVTMAKNKLLTVLSDAEQYALYGLPDFDDRQQLEYLSLSEAELALTSRRPGLHAQVCCVLQIGYFKAKCLSRKPSPSMSITRNAP